MYVARSSSTQHYASWDPLVGEMMSCVCESVKGVVHVHVLIFANNITLRIIICIPFLTVKTYIFGLIARQNRDEVVAPDWYMLGIDHVHSR